MKECTFKPRINYSKSKSKSKSTGKLNTREMLQNANS